MPFFVQNQNQANSSSNNNNKTATATSTATVGTAGTVAIYTTPLKALSTQKFMESRKIFGIDNVGLSTGDMSINCGAKIMVMNTEVYRNMAWRASSSSSSSSSLSKETGNDNNNNEEKVEDNELSNLSVVVLDEFHYMGKPGRGGVWEECVITSPSHTQITGLSATLTNANGITNWMNTVLSPRKTVLIDDANLCGHPVPLRYMFATRDGLEYLFKDENAGPYSPNGLLGLRGDGVPPKNKKNEKNKNKKNRSKNLSIQEISWVKSVSNSMDCIKTFALL